MSKQEKKSVLLDGKTYNILSIKQGGMGKVWILEQSFDEPFDLIYRRRLAVKTFDSPSDESQIKKELNIWISLDHKHIVPLKKIGRLDFRLAAIMPLLVGSLEDVLEEKVALNVANTSKVICDIAIGLQYAWNALKVLHLDLKPSNILIENKSLSSIKIADWGISRLAVQERFKSGSITNGKIVYDDLKTSFSAGTPLYMAPERFSGSWSLSPSADIFSLGLLAVQLNTGILPFRFGRINPIDEILDGSYYDNAELILSDSADMFKALCLECIDPNPSNRPLKYQDIIARLKSITRRG